MNEGDLVYIPQGVSMWSDAEKMLRMLTTDKPITAIFLSSDVDLCKIYASGTEFNVPKRFVYPMETAHAS